MAMHMDLIGTDHGERGGKWVGGVLGPDGKVYCVPFNARRVLRIDPATGATDLIGTDHGERGAKWVSGVLGPDGNVYCAPFDARRVLRIDPATGATDLIGTDHGEGGAKWVGGVVDPDGKVYCVPSNARRVLRIDPATGATDLIGTDHGEGGAKWNGGVVGPDGKVYCVPSNARRVLRIDPATGATDLIGTDHGEGGAKWNGGVVGPDGKVYCVPFCARRVLRIDPATGATDLIGTDHGDGGAKWVGGVLGPDGKVYCVPFCARRVLRIEPATGATDLIGTHLGEVRGKWEGGVLGPDGKVYCAPYDARRVLRIDPATGATDLIGTDQGEGRNKWFGGVLGPDGKVYCVPFDARRVLRIDPPVPRGWNLAASPMAPHEGVAPTTAAAGGTDGSDELLALRFQQEEERAARARAEAAAEAAEARAAEAEARAAEAEARAAAAEARAAAAERELAALRATPPPAAGRQVAVLTRAELETATRGFDEGMVLGEGGFGKVYLAAALPPLAVAPHGFAVKRLRLRGMQGEEQLHNEVQLLSSCQHEALVPLAGVCFERESLCLVYPLMVGGSLEDRLLPAAGDAPRRLARLGLPSPPAALTWQCRLRAMRDVARVLAYLHAAAPGKPVMLHRDVKPANVLLDAQLNAKLADVGLARAEASLGPGGHTHHTTQNVMGSPGFIDPLYVETGQYSEVTDGYALGISILMCLKPRSAVGLLDACVDALEDPTQEKVAAVVDPTWPADVALALMRVVVGLSWRRTRSRRMPIADAVREMEAVADHHDVRPGVSVVDEARECVICLMEPRAVRFGCGHCACCTTCAGLLQAQLMPCPVCRLPIRRFMEEGSHLALQPTFVELQ